MKIASIRGSLTTHDKPRDKQESKNITLNVIYGFITAFLLAVMNMLCNVTTYKTVSDFFTKETMTSLAMQLLLCLFLIALLFSYVSITRKNSIKSNKVLLPICVMIVFSYCICIIMGQIVKPYFAPAALAGLLVATLIDRKTGIMVNILVSVMLSVAFVTAYHGTNLMECISLLMTSMVGGTAFVLIMLKAPNRLKMFLYCIPIALGSGLISVFIALTFQDYSFANLRTYYVLSCGSMGCAYALFMAFEVVFEAVFKIDSIYKIYELCDIKNELLRNLQKNASGTYYHCLDVAALAEQCAAAIGENPTLAKACGLYHDIGKLEKPEFFVENQKGTNVHDELIPEVSVRIITSHTMDGYRMLKEKNYPDAIALAALEHHGTTPVKYFYYKAQNCTEDELEKSEFSYSDNKPTSKISAIIMIADTAEAACRSVPHSDDLRGFIHRLIKEKEDLGQFTDCQITFADIQKIEDVLVSAIPHMQHARIKYDNKKN